MKKIITTFTLIFMLGGFSYADENNIADKVISWAIGQKSSFSEGYPDAEIMKSKEIIYLSTYIQPKQKYEKIKILNKNEAKELINGDFNNYGIISIGKTENINEYIVNLQIGNLGRSIYNITVRRNKMIVNFIGGS